MARAEPLQPRKVPSLMAETWMSATTDSDPLAALGATRALIGLLTTWEVKLAGEAVAEGATWEAVGSSVGVSRQAAWERFHQDVGDLKRQVKQDFRALKEKQRQELLELRDEMRRRAKDRWHAY